MEIKPVTNPNDWDKFLASRENTLFVQSSGYGEFYKKLGEKSWIFGLYDGGELVGGSLVVSTHAKRGNFLYLPYGPILPPESRADALAAITNYIADFARQTGEYAFLRVSPFLEATAENQKMFARNAYRPAPMHVLAETTWLLDLRPSEAELFDGMGKNHRNLIRRCQKDGVKIVRTDQAPELDNFYKIYRTTARRHKFHKFSESYIKNEFKTFADRGEALLYLGFLSDGRLDSAAIVIYYQNMACYRHGASLNLNKKNPTSYLLQWEAIREAKSRGMGHYNFWGIAPAGASRRHPFWGITHFKKGFSGYALNLVHCQDYPLTKQYYLNWLIESVRRIRRGF